MEFGWLGIGLGVAGAMGAEFALWYGARHRLHKVFPDYGRSASYWIVTVGMFLFGGFLVWLHQLAAGGSLPVFVAVNVGATAPLALNRLTKGEGLAEPLEG